MGDWSALFPRAAPDSALYSTSTSLSFLLSFRINAVSGKDFPRIPFALSQGWWTLLIASCLLSYWNWVPDGQKHCVCWPGEQWGWQVGGTSLISHSIVMSRMVISIRFENRSIVFRGHLELRVGTCQSLDHGSSEAHCVGLFRCCFCTKRWPQKE